MKTGDLAYYNLSLGTEQWIRQLSPTKCTRGNFDLT